MNPEIFTDRARMVLQLALQEAQRLDHKFVGTEHILLAIAKEGTGVAANILKNLDVDVGKIRAMTEHLLGKQSAHSAVLVDEFLAGGRQPPDLFIKVIEGPPKSPTRRNDEQPEEMDNTDGV